MARVRKGDLTQADPVDSNAESATPEPNSPSEDAPATKAAKPVTGLRTRAKASGKSKTVIEKAFGATTGRVRQARYSLGDIVRHRVFQFRGVVFDVDPVFNNTEEWYQSIPAHVRPRKDQPFYHVLARNAESTYQAYVSEQNLLSDSDGGPVSHPLIDDLFEGLRDGRYSPRARMMM
jgi:heat shock protein HspQ